MKRILFFSIFILVSFLSNSQTLSGVPTFACVSLYGTNLSSGVVQYREVGSSSWSNGLDLWQDSRGINGRPKNEWRGSVVNLKSGTTYEFQAGGAQTTVTTWSESFPVGSTTTLTNPTTLTTSGTPTAYKVYTGSINGGGNNLVINASYIIIRGMKLSGATNDAIVLQQNAHDVIIEGCDISGWGQPANILGGNNQAAVRVMGFSYDASNVSRIIIQRNNIHDPTYGASAWDAGSTHAYGVNGINFEAAGTNQVMRYNSFYSSGGKKLMDCLGGANNFTYTGFPNANSDIYGNSIDGVWDDAIEAEGGNMNVRIWGNWMNNTFTGVATATVSIGPIYVWNNVSNVGQRLNTTNVSTLDNEDRGPFNKNGVDAQGSPYRDGRAYLFHNTILEPTQTGFTNARGLCGGPVDNGGPGGVGNIISRNNIWQTFKTSRQSIGENQPGTTPTNSYDYDLTNGAVLLKSSNEKGSHMETGSPSYTVQLTLSLDTNGYYLADGSRGKGNGVALNNFNDGVNVDKGAFQTGEAKLQFGVNAYLNGNVTPPPPNQIPIATASGNPPNITLPTNSVMLTGTGSDPDGTIIAYSWSKLSGPSQFTFSTPNAATTTVSNLAQGSYVFQLTVTDNKGATASANTTIVVNAAPPPPVTKFIVYTITTIKAVYSDSTNTTQTIKTQ